MGTRHLVAVFSGGDYKVAQYGQWDGYPDGQGADVLSFLRKYDLDTQAGRDAFREKLALLHWITEDEWRAQWVAAGADPNSDFVSFDVSNRHAEMYPQNNRDTGAKILEIVAENTLPMGLENSIAFAGDSLFCEWAYVIDLDANTFEVYKGFNKEPSILPNFIERFADFERPNEEYYPVRLVASYALGNLPTQAEFLARFKTEEEDLE